MNKSSSVKLQHCVKTEFRDSVAILRLIRPETKNSLSIETLEEIAGSFKDLEANSKVKSIVITASGDSFASGANLNELKSVNQSNAREFALRGQSLMQKIYNSKKFTVAGINGYCMGGGLDLALSCKKRIASPKAMFAHPGVNLGIITGWSGTQILPRLIGEGRALELFLTGKKIDSVEALRIGLIDEISDNLLSDCENITY